MVLGLRALATETIWVFRSCESNLNVYFFILRALALGNANAKFKGNLAFLTSKQSASGNGKQHYCKFFCNSATVQLHQTIAREQVGGDLNPC